MQSSVHTAWQLLESHAVPSFPNKLSPPEQSILHWCRCLKLLSRAECVARVSRASKRSRGVLPCHKLHQLNARGSGVHTFRALRTNLRTGRQTTAVRQTTGLPRLRYLHHTLPAI